MRWGVQQGSLFGDNLLASKWDLAPHRFGHGVHATPGDRGWNEPDCGSRCATGPTIPRRWNPHEPALTPMLKTINPLKLDRIRPHLRRNDRGQAART